MKNDVEPKKNDVVEPKKPEYADTDMVTCIRRNWGTSGVPRTKTDYIDRITFVGGVARNVPYKVAKTWATGHIVGVHILPNDATEADFIKVTGITPMEEADLASLLQVTSPEKLASLLSKEQIAALADHHGKVVK